MKNSNSTEKKIQLSKLVLGLWRLPNITDDEILSIINSAIELGITSIDQADIYGGYESQIYFGRALKKDKTLRKKIQIISKTGIILPNSAFSKSGIGFYDSGENHIIQSVETSLTDMGTDYMDLLLIHRPDLLMHPNDLDETLQKLKKQGKVLHFGVSNFSPSQFEMYRKNMETPLETNQVEFSLMHLNPLFDGTFDNCLQHNISPMIWSPLGGGDLFTSNEKQAIEIRTVLSKIGEELGGASIDQVALAWIMKHPSNPNTVIGTLKPERIKLSTEALNLDLSREQWYRILIAAQGHNMA
ncbi:MAG: aldo/keto reductase [Salinivirgaceae bacterium]|jgi:predicted oxidoreductase|nr:aldo/keto reductase [Salinivirgaceae bacterium]